MKYVGAGLDVGSTKITSVANGAANDDAAAVGQIGGGGPVSIHDYGPGVGEGTAATDDAAFAWLLANHAGRPWLLRADTTYNTSATIDISTTNGGGLIGGGQHGLSTKIQGTNAASPLIRVGGEGAVIKGLHLFPAATQTAIETAGSVFARANVEGINIYGGGKALYSPAGTLFFNNVFTNTRLSNFTDTGIEILNLGTGSVFTNTYIHSSTIAVPGTNVGEPCNRAIYVTGNQTTVVFDQLNIEYLKCSARPVEINGGGNAIFTSVWVEAVQWPTHTGIFCAYGSTNTVDIRGFEAVYLFPIADINSDAAETQAVFGVGGGAKLDAQSVRLRDNGSTALYLTRAIDTDANSRIRMQGVYDTGTVASLPGGHTAGTSDLLGRWPQAAWAQHPAGVWQQYNNNVGTQSLLWDGAAWVDTDGNQPIGGVNYIYLQTTGDPDPSGVMVAGDIRIVQ